MTEQIKLLEKREKEILEEIELGFSVKSLEEELYELRDTLKKLNTKDNNVTYEF